MAPIRYSLHYEDYSEHIMSRFGKLLQMQSLVDMTLMCSSHTLRVHKAVLAASSAYFQEVLQKQTGEPLIILKMRFSVLKCLVEFMYCGKTQCLEENLDELVSAAQFLKIKGLSKVTKEGLGITDQSEVPLFTPPVVISRPPQSLLDLHTQEEPKCQPQASFPPPTNSNPPAEALSRTNKDMVVRIPFDIENGGGTPTGAEYMDGPRVIKPRRGRPSMRQRARAWDPAGLLGRAAERTLLRREQDSRKAIHQLKHLQTKQMQDYIERVSLSEAVSSICGPDNPSNHNYMNINNDLMYMGHGPSNVIDSSVLYSKEHSFGSMTSTSYAHAPISSAAVTTPNKSGIGTAMSQYVNALKNAGLPTDLPILFESGDGSYINVNEQVLLDMVQSSEIQYEVIEQPNIIEKVADPSEIKSIDDLSKSIERGEMLIGPNSSKPYSPFTSFKKDSTDYIQQDETSNELNSILPDNLEPFTEQQNFVVMDPHLQDGNSALESDSTHNFSCMDNDMQFFTKSMSDEVKKYYEENPLTDDARELEQLCPASTSLDTNFSMSLLDTKASHTDIHQYSSLNTEDDFGLQLPQNLDFKEDALNCFMSTPKHNDDERNILSEKEKQDRAEIIKDLMNIADTIGMTQTEAIHEKNGTEKGPIKSRIQNYIENAMDSFHITNISNDDTMENSKTSRENSSDALHWNINNNENSNGATSNNSTNESENPYHSPVIDLTDSLKDTGDWKINDDEITDQENCTANHNSISPPLEHDIPFAVGLLPLSKETPVDDENNLKRKQSMDEDVLDSGDAKCLKRKIKYKKK